MNTTNGPVVGCEIELKNGQLCGIPAIGRCATCGRAFCRSHQAWSGQTYYIDQCAPCLAKAQADEVERRQEAKDKLKEERAFLQSGAARAALRAAGVQPVKIYHTEWKRRFFGLSNRSVEVIASVQHGWILGSLVWEVVAERADVPHTNLRRGLAALLDEDTYKLICVEPYLDSYCYYVFYREEYWQIGHDSYMWIDAAQAVRRLIELSHLGVQSIFTRGIPSKQRNNPPGRMQALAGRSGFIRIEKGKEAGRIYEIQKGELSIGRSWERDIFLEDFDAVDKLHATVINQGNGHYALRVDTEHHDTKVNGQLLPQKEDRGSQTYPLQDGDHIQLGQTVLVFGTK